MSFFPLSLSVAGVTNPTGGLFARFFPLCAYCSMGFFLEFVAAFFAFAIYSVSHLNRLRSLAVKFCRSYAKPHHLSKDGQARFREC